MSPESARVFVHVKDYGLLLQTDPNLPNVCALVTGTPIRGSWWAHPKSHDIFRVNCALAEHPDVLVIKLVSGKITYVHRLLWPAVLAVGQAREPWQMEGLSRQADQLLAQVDHDLVQTDRESSKAASELETRLLVYGEQFHTESGAHAKRLESWDHWLKRTGFVSQRMPAARARVLLEDVLAELNQKFKGRGKLPWGRS